jgi:hypothetical protein
MKLGRSLRDEETDVNNRCMKSGRDTVKVNFGARIMCLLMFGSFIT